MADSTLSSGTVLDRLGCRMDDGFFFSVDINYAVRHSNVVTPFFGQCGIFCWPYGTSCPLGSKLFVGIMGCVLVPQNGFSSVYLTIILKIIAAFL